LLQHVSVYINHHQGATAGIGINIVTLAKRRL